MNANNKLTLRTYLKRRGSVNALTKIEADVFGLPYPLVKGWAFRHGATEITAAMLDDLTIRLTQAHPATAARAQRGLAGVTRIALDRNASSAYQNAVAPGVAPVLHPLEAYGGIVWHGDGLCHLILMPGDARVYSIEDAEEFVAGVGGVLPLHCELQNLQEAWPELFKPDLYYTCEREWYDGDIASVFFDCATPTDRVAQGGARNVRARAVRRVSIQANSSSDSPGTPQVAAIGEPS